MRAQTHANHRHRVIVSSRRRWDVCQHDAPLFDNGHPLWTQDSGSHIESWEVVGDAAFAVQASSACAVTFDYPQGVDLKLVGTVNGRQDYPIAYVQITRANSSVTPPSRLAGQTQDAEGCRGVCQSQRRNGGEWSQSCTSYTWRGYVTHSYCHATPRRSLAHARWGSAHSYVN